MSSSDEQLKSLSKELAFFGATCGIFLTVRMVLDSASWVMWIYVFGLTPLGGVLGYILGHLYSSRFRIGVLVLAVALLVVSIGLIPYRVYSLRTFVKNSLNFSSEFRQVSSREIIISSHECLGVARSYATAFTREEQAQYFESYLTTNGWERLPSVVKRKGYSAEDFMYFAKDEYLLTIYLVNPPRPRIRLVYDDSGCSFSARLRKQISSESTNTEDADSAAPEETSDEQ